MFRLLKEMVILAVGFVALLYLLNPTLGLIEFIPDNFPLVGNLDEGAATALLLSTLAYYGIDLSRVFGTRARQDRLVDFGRRDQAAPPQDKGK